MSSSENLIDTFKRSLVATVKSIGKSNKVEINFVEMHKNVKLFSEIDKLLREHDFFLGMTEFAFLHSVYSYIATFFFNVCKMRS